MRSFLARLTYDVPLLHESFFARMQAIAETVGHLPERPIAPPEGGQLHGQPLEPNAVEHPWLRSMRVKTNPQIERIGNLAVVPITGALMQRPDLVDALYGDAEDTDVIRGLVEEATADDSVEGILVDINSPGGVLTGGPELADAVDAANKAKPTFAWTGGMAASLAYWVGSQAGSFLASRSAVVGSIGVYIAHLDASEAFARAGFKVDVFTNKEGTYKAAGFPGTTLSADQREHLQERSEAAFQQFKAEVLAKRPGVPAEAMRGQTFTGQEAKKLKLVDRVGDRSFALAALRSAVRAKARS